jgi:hypothetical protein
LKGALIGEQSQSESVDEPMAEISLDKIVRAELHFRIAVLLARQQR